MSLIWIVNILSVFFLCVFFAGIVIPQILLIAFRRRLFDEPDERKIHQCVVPRLGGMAFKPVVFFSFVLLLAVNVSTGHDELLKEIGAEALPLAYAFCAIIMLYLVGIADDLIGVRYRAKFFIQIVCGIMLVAGGVELSDLHGMLFIHSMPSWISIPLTVFVTVFIINAINLIDGIDGLASGLCSIAFLFYGMTFIWFHQYLYAMLAFATLGVLIPFYYYKEIYIETERIIIRNFKQKDAEGLLEYLSHPRVNCFAGDRLCSREAAWAYMQYSPKDMLRYAVSLKKDDFIIGDVFALRENEDTYKEGMAVLRQNKGLFALLLVGTLYMFVYMPINALYPLITMECFNGTPMHISITEIAYASGMLIGGLLLGLFGNYQKRILLITASIFMMGISLTISGLLPQSGFFIFVVCCAIMGLSVPFYSGVQTALFQEKIKPEYLGRVFSLTGSIMSLAMPIGLILSGFFADRIGVNHWFLLSGVLIIGIAIACPMITEVRKLDLKQNS